MEKRKICIDIRINYPVPQLCGTIFGNEIVEKAEKYYILNDGVIVGMLDNKRKLIKCNLDYNHTDFYDYYIN